MSEPLRVSVIIPTRNRPDKLAETIDGLRRQETPADQYEIIVVDDGSTPPVAIRPEKTGPENRLVRLEGVERSAARNAGAAAARGELLVFIDDDIAVGPGFLKEHLRAHSEWPDALKVGGIHLPEEVIATPFGRFRETLEQSGVPSVRGLTGLRNFCAAANMAIGRNVFLELGGFDTALSSSEDQDLAIRFTGRGGVIAYVPEALAVHRDSALDIRSYCKRNEWGMRNMIPFCRRYPDWPDNVEREKVNGLVRWGREPVALSLRKLLKLFLSWQAVLEFAFAGTSWLERLAPGSSALDRLYRLLLGAHIFRGYRAGIKTRGAAGPCSSVPGDVRASHTGQA